MTFHRLLMIGLLAILAAGCASNNIPDPAAESGGFDAADNSAETEGFGEGGMGVGEEFSDEFPLEDEMTMIIYFDFDQSDLRSEYSDLLARHAASLSNNRRSSVRLEGHTDERGSREYNIGLGERRSQAVRRLLLIQGAAADQISTVSFGEERPAAFGSDEDSHQLNRRVEITYTN